jgi:hypothetical protein
MMDRSFGFGLGLSFKGFPLGRVLMKPKSKKWTEATSQGLPLDPEAGFEFSAGFGSTSGLQWPEVTTMVDMGGGLSAPTSFELSKGAEEFSFLEGASSCLNTSFIANLSVFEGFANWAVDAVHSLLLPAWSGPVSSAPEFVSAFPCVSLPAISSPCSAFSGSPFVIASSSEVSVPFGCSDVDSKGFSEGFSPTLEFSEVGSDFGVFSLGVTTLGEKRRVGLPSTCSNPNQF